MSHLKRHVTAPTPQSAPLTPDQVANQAGGFVWKVDNWTRLRRFLILGTEGGSYYADERKQTLESVEALHDCVAENGARTVIEITSVSEQGRAPKNETAVFALAYAVANGDEETKQLALESLPRVCRIGTHLFQFIDALDAMGHATGRAKRRAYARWYQSKDEDALAYQLVKYRGRHGWTHRDVLRLARPRHQPIFEWVATGTTDGVLPELILGYELAKVAKDPGATAKLIDKYGLPREAVNSDHLTSPEVWNALLDNQGKGMPLTAMIRNLGNMTQVGLLTPTGDATQVVLASLADETRIRRARVHPVQVLAAMLAYSAGHGRGGATWAPVPRIVDALDAAFYTAFGNVEPTGKRTMLAIDISPSMGGGRIAAIPDLTPRMGAAAMALVTANVEQAYRTVAFAGVGGPAELAAFLRYGGREGLADYPLSPRQRLDDVVASMEALAMNYSRTDCSLPMLHAREQGWEIDTFVVYTDNETWSGRIHPTQALADYRRFSGIDARLVVVGMVANRFSIADPNDAGMLDCVGFDSTCPQMISMFARGEL